MCANAISITIVGCCVGFDAKYGGRRICWFMVRGTNGGGVGSVWGMVGLSSSVLTGGVVGIGGGVVG